MPFSAKTSIIPPTPGNSKMLWSPELFDINTGAYPKIPHPALCTYPMSTGQIQFYEGYYGARTWPIAFGAATDLIDPEKLYDEQDAVIVIGDEAASLFTSAEYSASHSGGPGPTGSSSESDNYQFTTETITFYTGEITFAPSMIIDPVYYLVFSADLFVQTFTFITEPGGGVIGGTYGPNASFGIEISKDNGATWNLSQELGTVDSHGSASTSIAKGTVDQTIGGAVNLSKLRFRIVAEMTGMSVYHVDGTGPNWTLEDDLSSNLTTNLFALFLEGTRYPLNILTISTGGDLVGEASTPTEESALWALGKLTYNAAIFHETFTGSNDVSGIDAYDNTYNCPGTPSLKLVINSTIYDIESFEWGAQIHTDTLNGGGIPPGSGYGIYTTDIKSCVLTLVGHPDLSAILSIGKEVYWI